MSDKPLCIYHAYSEKSACLDGFAAAWAVHHLRSGEYDFHPGVYGAPPPDVTGRHVLLVDFSYSIDALKEMCKSAHSVTVWDHHKTASDAICGDDELTDSVKYENFHWAFDLNICGARLTWQRLCDIWYLENEGEPDPDNPEDRPPPPALFEYIEARDLWQKDRFDDTDAVISALRSYPQDFDVWDRLMEPDKLDWLRAEGVAINRYYRQLVTQQVERAGFEMVGGHQVPTVNCSPQLASDVGHALLAAFPDAPFVATWSYEASLQIGTYQLRSEDDREDVGKIAQINGGGGHRNAAGFAVRAFGLDTRPEGAQ